MFNTPQVYPSIIATGGMNDPRVMYWEPLKWVARLRQRQLPNSGVVLCRVSDTLGHFGAASRYDSMEEEAYLSAFIMKEMGLLDDCTLHERNTQ